MWIPSESSGVFQPLGKGGTAPVPVQCTVDVDRRLITLTAVDGRFAVVQFQFSGAVVGTGTCPTHGLAEIDGACSACRAVAFTLDSAVPRE